MSENKTKPSKSTHDQNREERLAREAKALRANLVRRKQQKRGQSDTDRTVTNKGNVS